jgi:DNA-binding NarL/FixJ family response regulator
LFKILLVDDEHYFRRVIKAELSEAFPSLVIGEAWNTKGAIEKVESLCPQLIFMDLRLSDESGLRLTKEIKEKYPHITIAILTGYDMPEYREAAKKYGAEHFFIKGVSDWSVIKGLVESHLASSTQERIV